LELTIIRQQGIQEGIWRNLWKRKDSSFRRILPQAIENGLVDVLNNYALAL
jgi:hypothetical protein